MTDAIDTGALLAEIAALKGELERIKGKDGAVSPLAPPAPAMIHPVEGVTLAAATAGVRYTGRTDVMLARLAPGSAMAGVFTRSATRSAPVLWCQRILGQSGGAAPADKPLGIIVNSGNSNAFTGRAGEESVSALADAVSAALGTDRDCIYQSSTGVIGERLPHDRIEAVTESLAAELSAKAWDAAAAAIMTTDTFPKLASVMTEIEGVPVAISGFSKGSGMIAPDMATMLGYVFTDAAIAPTALQTMLSEINANSFNAITVDSDTSTSDTVLLAATGKAQHALIEDATDPRAATFRDALEGVMRDLAQQIVRDGEGASKFIAVTVEGAENDAAAGVIAKSIADSPLVKTAFAGEDPNWGRIVMAVGKSGEYADRDRLSIRFGDILVAEKGWVAESYREEDGATYMKAPELAVTVDVGVGEGRATVWTCDLTYAYIRINADYRS